MGKRKKCPEFENHERWLVAFADMMTLLFALFVVLYAIASVNTSKVKQVSESVQVAFGVKEEASTSEERVLGKGPASSESIFKYLKGNTSREQLLQRMMRERTAIIAADAKALEQRLAERLYGSKQFPDTGKPPQDRVVYVARDPDGIRITLLARKFFALGSTELELDAKKILDGIAVSLRDMGRITRIEGHTDNLPFDKNGMTNWELSATRAVSVTRYLISTHNFTKGSIYAAGFGDTKPLASNETAEDRALNRRVDLKILYDSPGDYIPPEDQLGTESEIKEE